LNRLSISESKLATLSAGLKQIAENTNILNKVLKLTKVSNDLFLKQITVPIGVLCVIFESRPDSLPQICALCISSGNGLLLKGGTEAKNTNRILHQLVQDSLGPYAPRNTISLLNSRDEINDLLELDNKYIDLIIPRGSNELVKYIQRKSRQIPVLGHAEGICHIYIDKDADFEMALKIIKDAKCGYPAACNAVETILINKDLLKSTLFNSLIEMLEKEKVKIYSGPKLHSQIKFAPPLTKSLSHEYSDLGVTIELIDDLNEAISHINMYGSHHTDSIITQNDEIAEQFLKSVDSACVFHNTSTRMSDGYRFGLGAEVGISTGRLHARGPVGIEGLLTTKWLLVGNGDIAEEFSNGTKEFLHEQLDPCFSRELQNQYINQR
jgi:delta-1-pyrroline-5-carboxylate synthetase